MAKKRNLGVSPMGPGQSAEPEPVARLRHSVTVPNAAPFYIIGEWSMEWTYDNLNFQSVSFADCESFGEYASRCFAGGQNGQGQR